MVCSLRPTFRLKTIENCTVSNKQVVGGSTGSSRSSRNSVPSAAAASLQACSDLTGTFHRPEECFPHCLPGSDNSTLSRGTEEPELVKMRSS